MDAISSKYSESKLYKIFHEIDAEMEKKDIPIHTRSIAATILFSRREKISLPITSTPAGFSNPNISPEAEWIATLLDNWYEERYAELLKFDFIQGTVLVTVSGIVFPMKIPTIFGSMQTCTWQANDLALPDTSMPKEPFNLACLVTNLTSNLAKSITTKELENLTITFQTGLQVYAFLTSNKKSDPLINETLNDIKASSNYFSSQNNALGQSRWSSLQAVEKFLKYSLKMANIDYPKTHILSKLAGKYPGMAPEIRELLNDVQIEPGVRYGEPSTSRREAYSAHISAINILGYLVKNINSKISYV